jgi:hypothetical protein
VDDGYNDIMCVKCQNSHGATITQEWTVKQVAYCGTLEIKEVASKSYLYDEDKTSTSSVLNTDAFSNSLP